MLQEIKKRKEEQGFTIIEVLIVLAIAGLILLIVFLAVPALQRNSRNTGRKEDAGRIGSAVNNFVSNNNGSLPSSCPTSGTPNDCATIINDAGNLNQYTGLAYGGVTATYPPTVAAGGGTIYLFNPGTTPAGGNNPGSAPTNVVIIADEATCNGTTGVTAGTSRQAAVVYSLESGSGNTWACLNVQ